MWWESISLLAVTTFLPAFSACTVKVCAGSSPPISSTMVSISGSFSSSL